MKWYNGSIDDAIKEAKQRNSMFIVYVEGRGKSSEVMSSVINGKDISTTFEDKNYVCVRIASDSAEYYQFLKIYKHVPVPSIFLIGLNGVPIAIIKSSQGENAETLSNQLLKALPVKGNILRLSSSNQSDIPGKKIDDNSEKSEEIVFASEMVDVPSENISGLDSQLHVADVSIQHDVKDSTSTQVVPEVENKDDSENTNPQIIRRQSENSDSARLQEAQQEKIRAESDRRRILNEIAMDKQERISRQRELDNTNPAGSNSFPPANNNGAQSLPFNQTYIQFRKPDGSTCTETFEITNVINDLRTYVSQNIGINTRQFKLATAFPRHIFTDEEINKSLEELRLVPNAVIIIIPISDDNGPMSFIFSSISSTFWFAATPFVSLYEFIRNSVFGVTPPQITGGVLQRPRMESTVNNRNTVPESGRSNQSNSRSKGNIRTMASITNDRDKDKNNVWNGNSTQQSQ